MKTQVLLLALVCCFVATAANQVPNGDFEQWRTGNYPLPSGFTYSSNLDRFYRQALPYNVERTIVSYQGMYALKLSTGQSFGNSPNIGYLLNYPPENGSTVGFPLAETPTGFRGYFRYLPVNGDSGLIAVQLLKEGSVLASYNYFIKGDQTTYRRFEFPFDKPLSQTPDAIQIGFASSYSPSMSGNVGTVLYLDSIGLMGMSAQPQELAGDFETWTMMEHNQPMAWTIGGQATNSQPKTNQRMSGNTALELRSFSRNTNEGQRADHRSATLGYWNSDIGDFSGGMPLSGTEDTLAFYYSFQPGVPGDSCYMNVYMYKGTSKIYSNNIPLLPTQGYSTQLVPLYLHQPFSQQIDSLVIEFVSGMWSDTELAAAGNILRVDAVRLLDYSGNDPKDPPGPVAPITETTLFPNGGFESWDEFTIESPTNYVFNSNMLNSRNGEHTMNVQKSTNAQHGSYALRLISQPTESDIDFGFVLNVNGNDGNPSTWRGGFPLEGRPTGISGHFLYNEATRDSGMIIVGFNKNGQVLHTYMLSLKGLVTSYTPFNFTFDPPLTEDPDSMVLGILSSSQLQGGSWPGCELIIDNINITGIVNQPIGMNGDFEDWQTDTQVSPIGWNYDKWREGSFNRTGDASKGNYAACLTTTLEKSDMGAGMVAVAGSVTNGYRDQNTDKEKGGIAFSNTKDTLVFMYKYIPANVDDRGLVILNFMSKGSSITSQTISLTASNTYKKVRIPIRLYQFSWILRPDSVSVTFLSSNWNNSDSVFVGSRLWVDDIHFASEFYLPPPYNPNAPNPPVPNGSFEQWETKEYATPVNYPFTTEKQMQPWLGLNPFVFRSTDAHHGQYALKLVSREVGDQVVPGFVSNSYVKNEGITSWNGGIPVAEKPTGLKGYYKYNMSTEDTAMIVAVFSKAGTNIGSYIIKLDGPKTAYTSFEYTFDPPMAETPDSMILAIASSFSVNESAYNGSELYLDELELTGVTQQPALLNGDFEDWLTESIEKPHAWALMGGKDNVVKADVAMHNQYALSLRTTWDPAKSVIVPGMAISTELPVLKALTDGGFPVTSRKDTLAFYYKYTPAKQDDKAVIGVYMFVTNSGEMINQPTFAPIKTYASTTYSKAQNRLEQYVWSHEQTLDPSSAYQYVEIPFDLSGSPVIPDRMIIMARSTTYDGNDQTYVGGELILDNFHFAPTNRPVVGLETINMPNALSLYPNPSRGLTRVNDPQGMYERIDVYNLMGQRVRTYVKDKGITHYDMDLTGMSAGLYLIQVSNAVQKTTLKLVVK